ncbi:hypothetical protein Moror_3097, partial [Moniliophthora roreri MCA 2997]
NLSPFTVSSELKTNIDSYGYAVLLSTAICTYKGNRPKDYILAIIKKFHFDLPSGIEHNVANWAKVVKQVEHSLTQHQSSVKKVIHASLFKEEKDGASKQVWTTKLPGEEQQNIFTLTQRLVEKT